MRAVDWTILIASLLFIVLYGLWKGRKNRDLDDYILAGRSLKWYTIALSIMATQASAITFISTPGQAYADGMRFVQFYLGLPVGMVILSITAVPIYHRLKVYTAYEYLEGRFDLKTRALAAGLFLVQRGLAAGLTIFAPALILSIILGWNLYVTNIVIGGLVVIYTALGGTKAVNWTNFHQMLIAMLGMVAAFMVVLAFLPPDVSLPEAVTLAGKMGRLDAIDFSFDWSNRYNFWSGLIGGMFLQLSYFGTDQSQVQRYLTGSSVAESRLALLLNGMLKVPMQFFILFVGAMVFVFYQFVTPPVFFNSVATDQMRTSRYAAEFRDVERRHEKAAVEQRVEARNLLEAVRSGNDPAISRQEERLGAARSRTLATRAEAIDLMKKRDPEADTNDTNFIFLTFVIHYLPAGLVGLVIAAVFAASMSSTSSELNALASTTVVDFYRRMLRPDATQTHYVKVSKLATLFWGAFAIGFAEYANRLGSLIEAVNILGSVFYGTILGIFLVAFYLKRVGATATFTGAILAEIVVLYLKFGTEIAFLWYNVAGCLVTVGVAILIQWMSGEPRPHSPANPDSSRAN
ncbi:MAG: sodium:solute symporter [Thermoanaerobaculia bacterium]